MAAGVILKPKISADLQIIDNWRSRDDSNIRPGHVLIN